MRNIALIALAASGLALFGALPAHAVGTRYPFCIQGNEFPGLGNCTFTSYDQCMATASGRFLTCVANPYFAGGPDDPYAYRNRHRPFPPNYHPARQVITRAIIDPRCGGAPRDHERANVELTAGCKLDPLA
jgi:hypothetical protein